MAEKKEKEVLVETTGRGVDPKKMVNPDISKSVEGQSGIKAISWILLAIGCVIAAIMLALWISGWAKEIRTGNPARTSTSYRTQSPPKREIVAPVGKYGEPINLVGLKGELVWTGRVMAKYKQFDGTVVEGECDANGKYPKVGKFTEVSAKSLEERPLTNWFVEK